MNLKKKFVVGAASLALVAGMGVAPAMAAAGEPVLLPGGKQLVRVAGDTRVETSIAAAKLRMKQGAVTRAYLVNQTALVDAATAGMVKDGVVLLVPGDKAGQLLLGATMAKDAQLKGIKTLIAVGGEGVMPKAAVDNVAKMNPGITSKNERLGGENRYETNIAIAKKVYPNGGTKQFLLARGDNMVDALTAGAYENAPTLLVNPFGAVDPGTVAYAKATKISPTSVILGGEGVLPTSQVQQLFEGKIQVNPWEYQTTTADLKKAVQEAAAAYKGQEVWQKLDGKTGTDDDNLENYFGINLNKSCTDTEDASDIDVKDGIDGKNCFIGYDKSLAKLKANAQDMLTAKNAGKMTIKNQLEAVKNAVDTAVATNTTNIAAGTPAKNTAATLAAGGGDYATMNNAFKAAYGNVELEKPTMLGGQLDNPGFFTFDTAGNMTGLDQSKLDQLVDNYIADKGDTEFIKVDGAPAAGVKLADVAKIQPNTGKDYELTAVTAGEVLNYAAIKKAVEARVAEQVATTDAAKKALDEAVQAYKNGPDAKVLVGTGSGLDRLVGENRYQTSALLSYWLRENKKFVDSFVYLASGNDAHLVDSVVAGQLMNGPILLVPTTGDLDASVKSEFTLMGKQKTLQGGYTMGGIGAIEDAVVKAAAAAITEGGKFIAPPVPAFTISNATNFSAAGATNQNATATLSRAASGTEQVATTITHNGTGTNVPTAAVAGTTLTLTGDNAGTFVEGDTYSVTVTISDAGKSPVSQTVTFKVVA